MDAALSIALGYFVGSLSPSSLVGRVKKTDVRKSGTGNLGATNTMLVLGWAIVVKAGSVSSARHNSSPATTCPNTRE